MAKGNVELKKPEYIGVGNFDEENYVYAYCKCPLSTDYAIKWPRIKDGKPHVYTCICENCGTPVGIMCIPESGIEEEKHG